MIVGFRVRTIATFVLAALFATFELGNRGLADNLIRAENSDSISSETLLNKIVGVLKDPSRRDGLIKELTSTTVVNERYDGGATPLIAACYTGEPQIVARLLDLGARADVADDLNRSPLWFSTFRGDLESVRRLLKFETVRTTINRGDANFNMAPLHLALDRGDSEIVELLIQAGASLSQNDAMGRSANSICRNVEALPAVQMACKSVEKNRR